jgi:hypothetical protein
VRVLAEIGDYPVSARFAGMLSAEPSGRMQAAIISMMGRIESDPDGVAVESIASLLRRDTGVLSPLVSDAAVGSLTRLAAFNSAANRASAVETLIWMASAIDIPVASRARAREAVRTIE